MNRTKNGYVVVVIDALTQRKTSIKLKDLKYDPDKSDSLTLDQLFEEIKKRLTDQDEEIKNQKKELEEFKAKSKKNINKLLNIVEILVNQTELNNMNINDLKSIKEEVEND